MEKEEILGAYIAATNTHDFDYVEKLLSLQAVYYFSDATCTTGEEIRAYFEKAWAIVKQEKYQAVEVQWLVDTDSTKVCVYTYTWEGYIEGIYKSGKGRATNIFVKEKKEWLLVHEHLG